MQPCDLLLAQPIVFNAVDYARSLGFEPPGDFAEPLFGPQPETLLMTPWAKPEKPIFINGPYDNVPWVLQKLEQAVGDNYEFAGLTELADEDDNNDWDDDDLIGIFEEIDSHNVECCG